MPDEQYRGKRSRYLFDGIVKSLEYWYERTDAVSLMDAADLLRSQRAELKELRSATVDRETAMPVKEK